MTLCNDLRAYKRDAETLAANARKTAEDAEELAMKLGLTLSTVCSGPGGGGGGTEAIASAVAASSGDAWFYDTSDASLMWQNTAQTTPAANGQPVAAIDPKYGAGDATDGSGVFTVFPSWNEAAGLLSYASATADGLRSSVVNASATAYLAAVVQLDATDPDHVLLSFGSVNNALIAQSGNGSAISTNIGTPTHFVDGALVTTRAQLFTALADNALHVVEVRNPDLSAQTGMNIGNYQAGTSLNFAGLLGDLVLCDYPGDTQADAIRAELAARHGITL